MTPVRAFPTLDQLAHEPARANTLPRPILLALHSLALQALAACHAGLAAAPVETPEPVERLIGTKELAGLMGVSSNFVFDHRHEWPFTIKRPGMRAMFSLNGYRAWVAANDGRSAVVVSRRASAQKGA